MRRGTFIDTGARRKVAELLRNALAGQISNMELDERFPGRSRDSAVHAVYCHTWRFHDDFKEYRLTGEFSPPEELRRRLERCALFMEGNLPYEWPSPLRNALMRVASLLKGRDEFRQGDQSVWPFFRRSDLDVATLAARAETNGAGSEPNPP
jgi:hypothetical protein